MSFREGEVEVEEINDLFGGAPVPTCVHTVMTHPMMKFALMIPLGAVIGFVLSVVGTILFNSGLDDIDSMMNTVGLNLGTYFDLIKTFAQLFFVVNLVVCIYGMREKFRVRWNCLAHWDNCCCWLIKCACVKPVFTSILVLFVVVAIICLSVFCGLFIAMWTLDEACKASQDAVQDILDLMGSYGDDGGNDDTRVQDTCDSINDGMTGGRSATTGFVLIVFAQIYTIGYWFKYTTLGALQSVKQAEDDAAKTNAEL